MKQDSRRIVLGFLIAMIAVGGFLFWQHSAGPVTGNHSGHAAAKEIYFCPMHPTYTSDKPGDCPICNMKLVKRESEPEKSVPAGTKRVFTVQQLMNMKKGEICLLHQCKMGTCAITMTEEIARLGKCPHCGEDLGVIVKEAMSPQGYADVNLPAEKQTLIGVKTAPVKKMPMTKTIRTVGRIAYDPELYQAEEEYVQAFAALKKAEDGTLQEVKDQASKLVESSKFKLKLMGLSEDLIKAIEENGKPDRSLLYAEPGGSVWLYVPVYEYELALVKTGEKVEAELASVPDKKFQGTIRSIDNVLDPMTRSVRVRAVLQNPDGFLKPEMYVNAVIRIDLGEVLAVPDEAVFVTGQDSIVFVAKSDGVFEPRSVKAGAKSEGYYEIKSGLSEGETVVTSGNFLIDSESRLKAALSGMSGGGHQHGT